MLFKLTNTIEQKLRQVNALYRCQKQSHGDMKQTHGGGDV